MKKRIIISLLAIMLLMQSVLPVCAAELPAGNNEDVNAQREIIATIVPDEDGIDTNLDDEIVGISATTPNYFYLTGESVSGYAILNPWKYFYLRNRTGSTVYWSNVYIEGNYQFQNRAIKNGSSMSLYANRNYQAVLYYKYDANTHKLLTTWSTIDDWKYLDVFPVMTSWEYNAIKYCSDNKLMYGTGENLFDPDAPITRAMFATIVYRMAGSPKVTYKKIFSDVPSGQWYSEGITWASQKGIIAGYGNGKYGPNDIITREQAAAILQRYADWRGYDTSDKSSLAKFNDGTYVSKWAAEDVKWAIEAGFLSGKWIGGKLYLVPRVQATRAECASMLMRFIENVGK
ncbi:MAG: S-layer homology domain-containing protein [Lachnospiraceae bacterium]|nr:S-layer homology domain-containing protein [Lachnospiraceae bacterium]